MIEIELTQGKVALIDDEDWSLIKDYRWRADKKGRTYYAVAYVRGSGKKNYRQIYMHTLIMTPKDGEEVDHVDSNGCNNQKYNLRVCSGEQNKRNKQKQQGNYTSKFKGVYWFKRANKWRAQINVANKSIHLGYFLEENDAAKAYNIAALRYFGKFAKINNVE